jgi:DNA-binding NarL/FixJ family response regulator
MKRKNLTQLEQGALALVLQGLSNKEIADYLGTDECTVKERVRNAYRVLGIRSTRQLLPIVEHAKEMLHIDGE